MINLQIFFPNETSAKRCFSALHYIHGIFSMKFKHVH